MDGEDSEDTEDSEDSEIEVGKQMREFSPVPLEERRLTAVHNSFQVYRGNEASYNPSSVYPDDVYAYTVGLIHVGPEMEPHETATRWAINLVYSTKSVGCWFGLMSKTAPVKRLDQPDDVPMCKAQWGDHLFEVEYSARREGHHLELTVHTNMELFVLQSVSPIDNTDLSLEHQSFLSTYNIREEILGQYKLGLLPVIVLANSSLTDGATKVKTELVSRAAEAGNTITATCFEIA